MKIAVISDIHENAHNLILAIKMIEKEKCDILFCLGDVGTSNLFHVMFTLEIPVYFTFGNHDGNVIKDTKMLERYKHGGYLRSNGFYQKVDLGGKKIFLTHYDDLAEIVAKSGEFDVCFGGHKHLAFEKSFGETLCVNPGEITGTRNDTPGFYIYDTESHTGKFHYISDPLLIKTQLVKDFYEHIKKY